MKDIKNFIYLEKNNLTIFIKILKIKDNFLYLNLEINKDTLHYTQDIILRDIHLNFSGSDIEVGFRKDCILIKLKKYIFSLSAKLLKIKNNKAFLFIEGKTGFLINKLLVPVLKTFINLDDKVLEVQDDILILKLDEILKNLGTESIKINLEFDGD